MLIELYGKNFGCFRDEFRLSMVAADIDPGNDRGIIEVEIEGEAKPLRLLRAAAIYGANASGKSTILRAAEILRSLFSEGYPSRVVRLSTSAPLAEAYTPFAGNEGDEPVRLGLLGAVEGKVYDYDIYFGEKKVIQERLSLVSTQPPIELFKRTESGVEGEWCENPNFKIISDEHRDDTPLLALAGLVAPKLAGGVCKGLAELLGIEQNYGLKWNQRGFQRSMSLGKRLYEESDLRRWVIAKMSEADVGITNLESQKIERVLRVATGRRLFPEMDASERKSVDYRLVFEHGGSEKRFSLLADQESAGTLAFAEKLPVLYDLINRDESGVAFVDEIHDSLHPTLLQAIIRHFNCEVPMKGLKGQLIFTTHETALLDAEAKDNILRRDQVYFTKKLADGSSQLYSLVEFKERNNLNLRKRYLEGRYGALPLLDGFQDRGQSEVG